MGPGVLNYTLREPLGVIARINAFNHPLLFAAMRTGAPLATGNTLIVKPPEQAPLSSLRFAELVGPLFPPGVFSGLPGGRECGAALTAHPLIAKVGLIGSVPTGKAIMRASADSLKKVALELGGKNALIAYPDASPDKVAAGIIRGMNFTWCGQSCGSTSRAFVHEAIHDAVLERVVAAARAIKPGIPTEQSTAMGSLISKDQFDKVDALHRLWHRGRSAAGRWRQAAAGSVSKQGLLYRTDNFRRGHAEDADCARRDLRPGAVRISMVG